MSENEYGLSGWAMVVVGLFAVLGFFWVASLFMN